MTRDEREQHGSDPAGTPCRTFSECCSVGDGLPTAALTAGKLYSAAGRSKGASGRSLRFATLDAPWHAARRAFLAIGMTDLFESVVGAGQLFGSVPRLIENQAGEAH
jgi:hypothetical protein